MDPLRIPPDRRLIELMDTVVDNLLGEQVPRDCSLEIQESQDCQQTSRNFAQAMQILNQLKDKDGKR